MADNGGNNIEEKTINYAWNWFEYHAGQRLTAFNYFLILIGVVVVGYLKCVELAGKSQLGMEQAGMAKVWWSLASAIGFFGMIISVAFWFLDIRNEELVNCGRSALDQLETSLGLTIRLDDKNRNHLKKFLDMFSRLLPISSTKILATHHFWLRSMILFSAIAFFIAALCAAIFAFYPNVAIPSAVENSHDLTSTYIIYGNLTLVLL